MAGSSRLILYPIAMAILIPAAMWSYFSPATVRSTHWELAHGQSVFAGILIARTNEIGVIDGRLRWLRTDWLATPEMPDNQLDTVSAKKGISFNLKDQDAIRIPDGDLNWHCAGFGYGNATLFRQGHSAIWGFSGLWQANVTEVCVPIWLFVLLAAIPMIHPLWKRRRPVSGRCSACGYDLRATHDRCPECGLAVEKNLAVEK